MKINRENKRKAKIIKNLANNITVLVTVISLFIIAIISFNNKTIVKDIKRNKQKALDQEGENYRLVTSADNVQVPVPKGYVASNVTGENYVSPQYQHTSIPHKGNYTELTWSSPAGEQYPWTQDENGIWISGNQGIPNSSSVLESEEFDYIKGSTLTINYTYSSQNGDYLYIHLINLTKNTTQSIAERSGNTNASFDYTTSNVRHVIDNWGPGRYKIRAIYSKNSSTDEGQDSGYIKTSTYFKEDENGTETYNEDVKTRIHDGGFVIYQLEDEEIETDPNGTNVIINDTNKDDEQSERNQYVWVPVPNVEDIVRTKTQNNGIMHFGQGYIFSDTSIIKETNTDSDYYTEPRLVADYDKTRYYLQKFSNLNKRENYLNEQQEDFKNMINSVAKYGGYYIGRYETGDEYEHNSSQNHYINPKIIRYNSNINYVTWYDSYIQLQRLSGKTGKYVKTEMICGCLWDYTLKWLNETDTKSYKEINGSSGTWGNCHDNKVIYKESANGPEKTKNPFSAVITPTGGITEIVFNGDIHSNFPTASNNIYDITGNMREFTRGIKSSYARINRGGDYANKAVYTANSRDYDAPYKSMINVSTRAQLYIL